MTSGAVVDEGDPTSGEGAQRAVGCSPAHGSGMLTRSPRAYGPGMIDRPVIVVSPPRSGSSLLFETLSMSPDLWTVGGESHRIIEGVPALHPKARNWGSNRLDALDAG